MSSNDTDSLIGALALALIAAAGWAALGPDVERAADETTERVAETYDRVLAWANSPADPSTGRPQGTAPWAGAPPAQVGELTVAAEHDTGYDRDLFGQRWKDTDRNGCGQRDDVLARDLTGVEKRNACVVVAGTLADPYTGTTITFAKADAAAVQIDHVVPLAEAWRSGAHAWTPEQREAFANDLDNLLAVDGPTNGAKGDSDPAEWMPPNTAVHCGYAAGYTAVKAEYGLTVDEAERDTLAAVLGGC